VVLVAMIVAASDAPRHTSPPAQPSAPSPRVKRALPPQQQQAEDMNGERQSSQRRRLAEGALVPGGAPCLQTPDPDGCPLTSCPSGYGAVPSSANATQPPTPAPCPSQFAGGQPEEQRPYEAAIADVAQPQPPALARLQPALGHYKPAQRGALLRVDS